MALNEVAIIGHSFDSSGALKVNTGSDGAAGSTQVSVSNFVAPSTQVSVSGYVAPSTQVSVSGYVAPSTTVTVSNWSSVVTVSGYVAPSTIVSVSSLPTKDCTSASGQAAAAGDNTILSSNSQALYVYAFMWSPISTAAQLVRWLRGSTSEAWRARVIAPSTIGEQAWSYALAVSPPAYLFKTSTGQNLVLNVTSSGVSYSVAAWRE